jgi:hypothetical protein
MDKKLYKLYSKYIISDDSEDEIDNDVNWKMDTEDDKSPRKKRSKKEEIEDDDEDEEVLNLKDLVKEHKSVPNPEINIEVVKDEQNNKSVKVSINLELENDSNDVINIDFIINKETYLKIAKQLK